MVDLELVEREHQIIAESEKRRLLFSTIPAPVKEACDRLIAAYRGDFLEDLVAAYSVELAPWVRRPLECPQKVQTTQMLTYRAIQLKLVGRHVVQRRMETFGVIDVFQKRLQARLCLLKSLILV